MTEAIRSSESSVLTRATRRHILEDSILRLTTYKQTNSVAFRPQANYADWATATCQRNVVPTFADRGVSRGQRGGTPTVVNVSFLDLSRYFFFQVAPHFELLLMLTKIVQHWNRRTHKWTARLLPPTSKFILQTLPQYSIHDISLVCCMLQMLSWVMWTASNSLRIATNAGLLWTR
jgi:hypothetical protein